MNEKMPHLIPQAAIDKYSRTPAATTISTARRLQEKIRDLLGADYETFLQGSYKNDTAIRDLDDVDIVAIRKEIFSGTFSSSALGRPVVSWDAIFTDVEGRIRGHQDFRGKVDRGDKCVKVASSLNADVVPAVKVKSYEEDPIAIFSWRAASERLNYPRVHYSHNVAKHGRTNERYKPTVRMLKNWARSHFGENSQTAPSFYLECLVYNVPDHLFVFDGAERFSFAISSIIGLSYSSNRVVTVAGDKDILLPSEWTFDKFASFQSRLLDSHRHVRAALDASSEATALMYWRLAFNE